MTSLEKLITTANLQKLAGTSAFERGADYFAEDAVEDLRRNGEKVSSRVIGSKRYQVELWIEGGELAFDCTCPRAAEGYFCKHCVAVGLGLLDGKDRAPEPDPDALIRDFLQTQPPEYLIGLLLNQARQDEALHRSLLLRAERSGGSINIVKSFRKAIDSATRIRGYVDWGEASGFASGLNALVDSLEELLDRDTADALVELTEYAIERVDGTLESVDDSDGEVGGVLDRLAALHLEACTLAQPDPIILAERLFRYELTNSFDPYYNSVRTYQNVLGPTGIARFRELAEQQWAKNAPKGMADKANRGESPNRFRITQIMQTLAEMAGDIDALVEIKSRDLSHPYSYLTIAEIYQKCDRHDLALEWAERGIKAFPERADNRLRDFLVAEYLRRKRDDEAVQLTWVQFEERQTLEHYRKLHEVAKKLGRWPEQRQRAVELVEAVVQQEANKITRWKPKPTPPDWSLRIEIALWENDLDTAWQMIQHGTCRREPLLSLAGNLEKSRPGDAATLYRRIIPDIIEETNNRAYEEAIRHLGKIGGLMQALGNAADFKTYAADLRAQYKAKRNFIKRLDELILRGLGN